jgi:serine kinase of HPr protein (carbohydrate metabolism regulator)
MLSFKQWLPVLALVVAASGCASVEPDQFAALQSQVYYNRQKIDRLEGSHSTRKLLEVEIPQTSLPVAAGRNLAILVETAVRHHMLSVDGYNAARDFIQRQQDFIEQHGHGDI